MEKTQEENKEKYKSGPKMKQKASKILVSLQLLFASTLFSILLEIQSF